MQDMLDSFRDEVRRKRKKQHMTQRQLADKLHLSLRTIMDIENGHTVPRLDTVICICLELDISLDSILYPNLSANSISKTASDFFSGKSEQEVQKFIALCQCAESLRTEKVEATV